MKNIIRNIPILSGIILLSFTFFIPLAHAQYYYPLIYTTPFIPYTYYPSGYGTRIAATPLLLTPTLLPTTLSTTSTILPSTTLLTTTLLPKISLTTSALLAASLTTPALIPTTSASLTALLLATGGGGYLTTLALLGII
ncbi:MAG: hypothetical protein ACMUJM_20385 [bacterium]